MHIEDIGKYFYLLDEDGDLNVCKIISYRDQAYGCLIVLTRPHFSWFLNQENEYVLVSEFEAQKFPFFDTMGEALTNGIKTMYSLKENCDNEKEGMDSNG